MRNTFRFNKDRVSSRSVDELLGLAKGLIADGKLCENEVDFLCSWLSKHTEQYNTFPFNILFDRIEAMLKDNVIDEVERKELFELLSDITGEKNKEVSNFVTTLPLTTPCPEIIIQNKKFCLTGTFLSGQRKDLEKLIEQLGGTIKQTITLDLDYLVIGSKPTKDWKHSSFGNKIVKAIEYNNKNGKIFIVCENDWIQAIKN